MKKVDFAAAQKKKTAALDKWEKEVLPDVPLKIMEFPERVQVQTWIQQGMLSTQVCAEAACQGLVGMFIDELAKKESNEADLAVFRKYSDDQIIAIGGRVIELSGNPSTD
jgi:hypothetical protein